MVSTDGYVKILDFGLAKRVDTSAVSSEVETLAKRGTGPGVILGTVGYMSPEQARGEPADARSDPLGAILYELVSGRRPFAAPTAVETLAAVINEEPEPLTQTSPALARVIGRCLSKSPEARFGNTADLLAALDAVEKEPVATVTTRRRDDHTVGREDSLRELRAAVEDARAGHGSVRAVAGEAGIGKTTLVETFLADVGDAIVCRGRCSERLAGAEAYLPFLDALEGFRGDKRSLRMLEEFAPRWYEQIVVVRDGVCANRAPSQERMKREMATFFEALSRRTPVIVFFDDLHWADESTVDLLAYLGARLDRMRVVFVLTYRPADLKLSDHPFVEFKLDLQARGSLREIDLPFLSRSDVARYIDLEFPNHALPPDFPGLIHEKTEGNPLFMVDLLQYLRGYETLAFRDDRWVLAGSVESIENELPQSVRGMIERKLGRLSEDDRKLMVTAAVEGYRFRSAIVASVLEQETADIEERLQVLDRVHGLVKLVEEEELPDGTFAARYQFVHVLYQNALDASLTPSRRVSLSRRVAQATERAFFGQTHKVASELAVLFESGRAWARAAHCCRLASENANRIFASREALRLARKGIELLDRLDESDARNEEELHLRLAFGLSAVALEGHSSAIVGDAYNRAWELSERLGDRLGLQSALAGIWGYRVVRGDSQAALEAAQRLFDVGQSHEDSPAMGLARFELGATFFYRGSFDEAYEQLKRGIALADRIDTTTVGFELDIRVNYPRMLAQAHWIRGFPDEARATMREALARAKDTKHLFNTTYALFFSSFLASLCGERKESRRFAEELVKLCREQGYRLFDVWAELLLDWSDDSRRDGRVMRDRIEPLWREIGAELLLPFWLSRASELDEEAGRSDGALVWLQEAEEVSKRTGQHFWDAEIHRLRGEAYRLQQRPAHAVEACFHRALELARGQGARSFELRAATSLARSRGADEARALLAECRQGFTEGFDTSDLKAAQEVLEK